MPKDIYSLGATLYAALTGMIPEDGLARAMDNATLTPLRKRNPRVTRRLSLAIEKAMSVDPADRYQTAGDFKKALLGAKARTERPTGDFTVAPPPIGSRILPEAATEDMAEAKPKANNTPLPVFAPEEQKPFVPPSKRRRRNPIGLTLLFILMIAAAGVFFLYPNNLYASVRDTLSSQSLLPALRAVLPLPFSNPTATATDAPTATSIPPTATSLPTATATLAPTSMPTATAVVAVPLGGAQGRSPLHPTAPGSPRSI